MKALQQYKLVPTSALADIAMYLPVTSPPGLPQFVDPNPQRSLDMLRHAFEKMLAEAIAPDVRGLPEALLTTAEQYQAGPGVRREAEYEQNLLLHAAARIAALHTALKAGMEIADGLFCWGCKQQGENMADRCCKDADCDAGWWGIPSDDVQNFMGLAGALLPEAYAEIARDRKPPDPPPPSPEQVADESIDEAIFDAVSNGEGQLTAYYLKRALARAGIALVRKPA
jgi:hypothetical protein